MDESRENAQEAIRRHLEAAEDYYYKPANKDPEYVDVPDSPEPQVGVTVYENLEQMAKAGVVLFTGIKCWRESFQVLFLIVILCN